MRLLCVAELVSDDVLLQNRRHLLGGLEKIFFHWFFFLLYLPEFDDVVFEVFHNKDFKI